MRPWLWNEWKPIWNISHDARCNSKEVMHDEANRLLTYSRAPEFVGATREAIGAWAAIAIKQVKNWIVKSMMKLMCLIMS